MRKRTSQVYSLNKIRDSWRESRLRDSNISFRRNGLLRDKTEGWLRCTYSTGKARGLPGSFREAAGNQLVDWPTWDHLRPSATQWRTPRGCISRCSCTTSPGATRHEHHERGKLPCSFLFALRALAEPRDRGTSGIRILGTPWNVQFRRSIFTIALLPNPNKWTSPGLIFSIESF